MMNFRKTSRRRPGRRTNVPHRRPSTRSARRTPGSRHRGGRGYSRVTRFRLPLILGGIGAVAVVAAVIVASVLGGFTNVIPQAHGSDAPVAEHIVYTAPTANDASVALPSSVQGELVKLADGHKSIAVSRIEGDGTVATHTVDLTPRTGDNPNDPPLTVPERSRVKTQAKIAQIEKELNTPSATGNRALFKGLTKLDFTGAPVVLVSSLIDLTSPADFRTLNWKTDPADVVAAAKGTLPTIGAPVTFVVVPAGGDQRQLGAEDKTYSKNFWSAVLLQGAHATDVTFVDSTVDPGAPVRRTPTTPVVEPQPLPDTPIAAVPAPEHPGAASCTIAGSYFGWDSPDLVDRDLAVGNLAGCVNQALAACSTFQVDGWASYEGELTPDGQPTHNDPANQQLSDARVATIVTLLTTKLRVAPKDIVSQKGHGNLDLPVPGEPSSAENRVVRITYTPAATGCSGDGR